MLVAHARRARSAAAFAREAKRSERVHHSYVEGGTDPGDIDHPIPQRHVYISIKSHEGKEMEREGVEAEERIMTIARGCDRPRLPTPACRIFPTLTVN